MFPYIAFNAFWLILKWLLQNVQHVFCVFKMYNTGWDKSRRSLHCFFTNVVEISGRYLQIVHRSGKNIIITFITEYNCKVLSECYMCFILIRSINSAFPWTWLLKFRSQND